MRYFDAISSSPLHPAARDTLLAAIDAGFADPRRLHHQARNAAVLLDNARAVIAEALGVRETEVTFTASGTEAVHRGLLGLIKGADRPGHPAPRLVASAVEHSSVWHAARWAGLPHETLAVDHHGRVRVESVSPAAADQITAVQLANHEVGTIQPIEQIRAVLDQGAVLDDPASRSPLFMDACAALGRLALPSGWDVAAGSAHKWGGPAGVGLLLVRQGTRWRNPLPDDDRRDPRSSGFENVPAALAAAAALQAVVAEREEANRRLHQLVAMIRARVAELPDVEVVGDPERRLPHLVTFSLLYLDGEALVTELDRLGFSVASGSACTSSALAPSHVLEAMGALTHGNVRVSLTSETTEADVIAFCDAMPRIVDELRARVGL